MKIISALLEKQFKLLENNTNIRTECMAGVTTFLTMVFIIVINPVILHSTGMDLGAVFMATCFITTLGCFLMALLANYPVVIAPAMGMNVYFSYVIVQQLGFSWQSALGLIFIAGLLFFLVTITRLRKWVIESIPESLILAITAGLGLFIAVIALNSVGIIISEPGTMISLGKMSSITVLLFSLGFCLIVAFDNFKIPGAIIIGILIITLISFLLKINSFQGVFSMPPSIAPTFMAIDLKETFHQEGLVIIFTFFLISFFDNTGTMVGLLQQTNLKNNPESMKRLSRSLLADSIATMAGALLGTSTTTPYLESATGMRAGGKTGLTAVVVGLLFLCATFLSPLTKTIPVYATAPALLFVACLMIKHIIKIPWRNLTESIPGIITFLMIPFTYSIAYGVGLGIVSYVFIKILCGKWRELNVTIFILALIFSIAFVAFSRY